MGDVFAFKSDIEILAGNAKANQVGERRTSVGVGDRGFRRGLSDVTNLQQKPNVGHPGGKTLPISAATSEYIDKLHKENALLAKQLAERNKIIEVSAAELQRLRVNLQMTHQQNCHLAQRNSQMLADLNSGKDRLKAMQHEVGCLKAVLSVKNQDMQKELKTEPCQPTSKKVQEMKLKEAGESSLVDDDTRIKPSKPNTRRLSRALSTSVTQDATAKDKSEAKGPCKRRRSSRLRSEDLGCTEDLFEIDDAKFPVLCEASNTMQEDTMTALASEAKFPVVSEPSDTMQEDTLTALASEDNNEDTKVRKKATISGVLPTEMRRSSIGRPLRRAAEKVQTYKEIPVNVKMRRSQ